MAAEILGTKQYLCFRVLTKDQVVYVLYDVERRSMMGTYRDERFTSPAGLWAWQEKEVKEAIEQHFGLAVNCTN